jgi:hypothetical protein
MSGAVEQLLQGLNYRTTTSDRGALANQWFGSERGRKEILEILKQFELDEYAIEAAAVRFAAPGLEKLDRLMASAETRLSKALRVLADLRGGSVGQRLRAKVEQVVVRERLALADASKKGPSEAA